MPSRAPRTWLRRTATTLTRWMACYRKPFWLGASAWQLPIDAIASFKHFSTYLTVLDHKLRIISVPGQRFHSEFWELRFNLSRLISHSLHSLVLVGLVSNTIIWWGIHNFQKICGIYKQMEWGYRDFCPFRTTMRNSGISLILFLRRLSQNLKDVQE